MIKPPPHCFLSGVSKYTAISKETSPVLHQRHKRTRERISSQSAMPLARGVRGRTSHMQWNGESMVVELLSSELEGVKAQELG